jgi:adenylate kinase
MRMVLLGAPGSGKGTQAELLAERYKVPQFSPGDLLRDAVAAGSALGRQAKLAMDAGQLVADDIMLGIIQERILRPDTRNGFILDGFPRSLPQAEALDQLFEGLGRPLNLALLLAVDVDALLQRLVGRRTCLSCGREYNIFYSPPHIDGQCDACGGRLRHRADDNEETIGNRLRVYETNTLPVIEYYKEQGKLRTVQGVGAISYIFNAIRKVVDDLKAHGRTETRSDAIRRAIARQQLATDAAQGSREKAASAKAPRARKAPPQAAPRKSASGKPTAPEATARKEPTTKAASRKVLPKTGASGKTAAGRTAARRKAARPGASSNAARRKAPPKKAAVKKSMPRKAAPRKAVATKVPSKKAPPGKTVHRKAAAGKAASGKTRTRKSDSAKKTGKNVPARK